MKAALNIGQELIKSAPKQRALTSNIPSWRQTLKNPAKEFALSELSLVSGKIPASLRGSLYKNGPGRITRGDQTVEHWFDGDGAILAVHFEKGKVYATYKYIQSDTYKEEEAANKFIYAGFGSTMNVPFWKRPLIQKFKNPGNISIHPLNNKLLALWEGGLPYDIDLEDLGTKGLDDLGFLTQNESFSAHPKVDPETQEIYNFGIKKGPRFELCVYKMSKFGKLLKQNSVPVRFNSIHDCVIAGKYLIIMNFATKITSPFSIIFGLKTIKESIKPAPELGTEVYIFDRNDMSLVNKFSMDPFYSYHFSNGYEDRDGSLYIEYVRHNGFHDFDKWASAVPDLSRPLPNAPNSYLSWMKIDPKKGKLLDAEDLMDIDAEFPSVAEAKIGKKWRYSMFATGSSQNDHAVDKQIGAIGRYDYKTQNVQTIEFGKDKYISEPSLASSEEDPENGHILSLVYDAASHKSEIWVHDSKTFDEEPICKLALPEVIPLGFHGKWLPKN